MGLKVKKAELEGIYVDINQLPAGNLPEIALTGRSNVGKSSLINKICNRKKLAKSSSTPGKTRTINYYLINDQWFMVDLPGYGYARVSREEKSRWKKMIEAYLSQREQLRGVIQLLDIRHEPGENDILMKDWLLHLQIPVLIVATKADKLSRGARMKNMAVIRKTLDLPDMPLVFSAHTGEGVEELKAALAELLSP
ncbi:MAG: ribosome biogenesis GTP-binding protein YihA/YsxC [Syntrophomonas sp.]|uniref:ribosome biogenesis GTP-binding protein YihA/YsxC n=1 Tax=Syntrophomonas sp. TaxID=2053627 RepID=UPI0026164A3D|nr:ribosome biogenesis GTP-binding protein YihA/YsxC [Syntrophomonas sp.]MDD2510767.1 ribosome biogenesis GTP-binding protein YihA/YsxC [Syntrophomonas sp.]MDD3880199.1 ribosome biogenesis GTP-binding protein YihA/YsxC [Syntrophomonas sp.]MDD4625769.1 ribosome biogenesis GTP-binding protein YihA/YsxC [Syntrophomonas sp.]